MFVFLNPAAAATNMAVLGAPGRKEDELAKELQILLDKATYQSTGCAAAGHTGCCTEDNCKTDSGCYCDVRCYYFRNCCDDIISIGCYRKSTIQQFDNMIKSEILTHCWLLF